jgi:hypothetical protein
MTMGVLLLNAVLFGLNRGLSRDLKRLEDGVQA